MPSNVKDHGTIFDCQRCGDCCKGYGGTFLSDEDIVQVADHIGSDPKAFLDQYCTYSGRHPLLRQRSDGYCIFWDEICTIHPVKPKMCRTWPYISSVMIDVQNWYIMATSCPGMRTDIDPNVIRRQVKAKIKHSTDDDLHRR